tara:strand:- start:56 stop:316 length:261 start_codon:yes stop_codon:yes gene_type:complete
LELNEMNVNKDLPISLNLDLSGLNCPLPILKTKKKLGDMQSGQLISVTSTDSGSYNDFKYFCEHTGHELISREQRESKFYFIIKKK